MAETYRTTLKLRRGFAEVWEKNNPILQEGEPGYALDTKVLKIGDGITPWLELKGIDSSDENYDDIISELESKLIGKSGSGQNSEIFNGTNNQAIGSYSHAEGLTTKAMGNVSHAEGESTIAYTTGSHAEGKSTQAGGKSVSDISSNGSYAHAEGVNSIAYARGSHAEGESTLANNQYSHAEGGGCQAYGDYSHAEGCNSGNISTTTYSKAAHAEGIGTWARGEGSHTEGKDTLTNKNYAHAEGEGTVAGGVASHSEGKRTIATGDYQHAQGKYNVEDRENKYAHIVGGGSSETDRKNLHTIDWDGNAWFAGKIKIGGTGQDDENVAEVLTTADMSKIIEAVLAALPTNQ